MASPRRICGRLSERCCRCCKALRSLYSDSPFVFTVVLAVIFLILLVGGLFSKAVSQYVGSRGAVLVDLSLFWLFARLVARALMFPGSLKIFQRNTEATFRHEMAQQYIHLLRQLTGFVRFASRLAEGLPRGTTAEGILRGVMVIENLSATYRLQQQQHGVELSKEQLEIDGLVQEIERWLKATQVRPADDGSRTGAPTPLVDWLKHQVQVAGSQVRQQMMGHGGHNAFAGVTLAAEADDVAYIIERLDILLVILEGLRHSNLGFWQTAKRFLRVPAVGSLNQLRAELQIRFGGQRCWVTTKSGHQVDGMFIPCDGPAGWGGIDDEADDTAPLNGNAPRSMAGPTVIWCNPNAAYYETMVYQGTWLNFWLSRGVNLFLFNYSGYGRSSGLPSPSKIAEDGDAVVAFLKGKGITEIAVYGRSIGGVAACHLARKHTDVVKMLIADRTMSELKEAAKLLYGSWAAKGLQLTRMTHNNVDNFLDVRCYKLLIVDPKDTMILDMAALRTGVALRAVERLRPEERFEVAEDMLRRLAEAWSFFHAVVSISEGDDDAPEGHDVARQARQPNFRHDDHRQGATSEPAGVGVGSAGPPTALNGETITAAWLQDNAGLVRQVMAPFVDQTRTMMDVVGEQLEAGGTSLNDAILDNPGDPCPALRSFLANMQIWGTLGDPHGDSEQQGASVGLVRGAGATAGATDREIEVFLRKDFANDILLFREVGPERMEEVSRTLSPEALSGYHRRLARARVAEVRKELRRRLSQLDTAIAGAAELGGRAAAEGCDGATEQALLRSLQAHLAEVDSFVNTLYRFFKSIDLALPYSRPQQQGDRVGASQEGVGQGDSSDEKVADGSADGGQLGSLPPQPAIDHAAVGYIMHVDCGHNGLMDAVECRQLALHLRSAHFGQARAEAYS